jgi:formylglycine-generating enzyme required for sulfatase activity
MRAVLLAGLATVVACHEGVAVELCEGVSCSYHGNCVVERVVARCDCDEGFKSEGAEGLSCMPDEAEGDWVFIASGTVTDSFQMGSPSQEVGRQEDETQHAVILSRDFVILAQEVTLSDFLRVLGYIPTATELDTDNPDDLNRPVDHVTWHEAASFCNALSDQRGLPRCYNCEGTGDAVRCEPDAAWDTPFDCLGYRLPTEAEWEYAARAQTFTATYNGDLDPHQLRCEYNEVLDPIAAFCGNSDQTRPVRVGKSNDWGEGRGLYDVLGNVREWCHDWYDDYPVADVVIDPFGPDRGDQRVQRGGSWDDLAADVRAARRFSALSEEQNALVGFRPVRTPGH